MDDYVNEYEKEFSIYGVTYVGSSREKEVAVCAADSGQEAINLLEKALVDGKGYKTMKGNLIATAERTSFTTTKKGIIFGYDLLSNSFLE